MQGTEMFRERARSAAQDALAQPRSPRRTERARRNELKARLAFVVSERFNTAVTARDVAWKHDEARLTIDGLVFRLHDNGFEWIQFKCHTCNMAILASIVNPTMAQIGERLAQHEGRHAAHQAVGS